MALLLFKKITISAKNIDFPNFFFEKLVKVIFQHIGVNKHIIKSKKKQVAIL